VKILHVVPTFYPAHIYGGPIQSVYMLCCYLGRSGCDVRVLTTNANGPEAVLDVPTDRDVPVDGVSVRYCPRVFTENASIDLLRRLPSAIAWADVVHLTAVYSFPTFPALALANVIGRPVVWSPRGSLQRWRGSTNLRAKSVWERMCTLVASRSVTLHVTSAEEAEESASRIRGCSTAIIPNGVEIPPAVTHEPGRGEFRMVYLGRLHQKKGLENLFDACSALLQQAPGLNWTLNVAGAGEPEYTESLRQHIHRLRVQDRITLAGEVVGAQKTQFFAAADLLVMPSHTENFGMVVVEALAHGVPALASTGSPWQRLETVGCGFWVPNDAATLTRTILRACESPLRDMGQTGREWMLRDFSWNGRAAEILELYRKVTGRPLHCGGTAVSSASQSF